MKIYFLLNLFFIVQGFFLHKNTINNKNTKLFNCSPYEKMLKKLNSKNQTERDSIMLSNENYDIDELNRKKFLSLQSLGLEISFEERGNEYENDPPNNGYGPHGKEDNTNYDEFSLVKKVDHNFDSIGGYSLVKKELYQCIDILKNYKKYKKFNVRIPKGLIFEGPPGTGKTLFAKALAGEAKCSFIAVSGSDFARKYVGEGSAHIKKLFSLAKKNLPCIIFIDELDSIGRKRSSDGESASSERDNTLNSLLVELDGFKNSTGIFVVTATNRIDIIDPALLRPGRIDKNIRIDLPDSEARNKIINIHIKGKPYDNSINIFELTNIFQGLTGAQIENVLNEAMLYALRNDREYFTMDDINFIYDKILTGWQPTDHEFTDNIIERIAVHEMGHAIIGILSQYHSKLNKVVINLSSPNSPGYTVFRPEINSLQLKEALFEHLMILLAGRIAEEEIFGLSITTGASNDLFEAHKLATNMIEKYGMGTHIIYPSNSEKYKIFKDNDIINLIEYAEQLSREIIHKSKDLIIYTSKILIKNKIITFDELENIININYKKSFITKYSNNKIKSYNNFVQLDRKNINYEFELGE
jgi:cell division protease FtsH